MTRLDTICDLVTTNYILDVGSDHGFVPKLLLNSGKISHAFVSDISQKCLDKARANLEQEQNSCSFLLGNGLEVAECISDVFLKDTTAIITGMGGKEIMNILSANNCNFPYYILGAQTKIFQLKDYLFENKFNILKDIIVKDDEKFYNLLLVSHASQQKKIDTIELYFGKDNLIERGDVFMSYCIALKEKYEKILKYRQNEKLNNINQMLDKILGERKC